MPSQKFIPAHVNVNVHANQHSSTSASASASTLASASAGDRNDDCVLMHQERSDRNTNQDLPLQYLLNESKFGAFGSGGGTMEDDPDFHIMGDEELQIVRGSCKAKAANDDHSRVDNDRDDNDDGDGDGDDACISILNPNSSRDRDSDDKNRSMTSDGFDVCLEYGYRYEFTEEDENDNDSDDNDNDNNNECGEQEEGEGASFMSKLRTLPLQLQLPLASTSTSNPSSTDEQKPTDNTNARTNNNKKTNRKRSSSSSEVNYQTNLLGKIYHPINDYHLKRSDEANLIWMTYRCDFLSIKPYEITSDAGWGCMLRSAQMLLAQVLRVHFKGREWRLDRNLKRRREDGFLRDLLTWFADYPSSVSINGAGASGQCLCQFPSSFSLHNMVAAGMARYDILPGEWFGPGTACHVLRDLVNLHSRSMQLIYDNDTDADNDNDAGDEYRNGNCNDGKNNHELRVYVAPEGTIYQSDLRELLTKPQQNQHSMNNSEKDDNENENDDENENKTKRYKERKSKKHNKNKNKKNSVIYHPLYESPVLSTESNGSTPASASASASIDQEWDASLLILIPLRLGLTEFSKTYRVPLAHVLSFSQSVGIIGGSPRHALWFYGANSDGSKVFGLDPHTVQRAPRRTRVTPDGSRNKLKPDYEIVFSDEYLRSINCTNASTMDMTKLDPSLALGFYCRDRKDYESFCESLKDMKDDKRLKGYPELFTIAEAKPNYEADVSSAMLDMMMSSSSQLMEGGDLMDDSNNVDDDDEYILL